MLPRRETSSLPKNRAFRSPRDSPQGIGGMREQQGRRRRNDMATPPVRAACAVMKSKRKDAFASACSSARKVRVCLTATASAHMVGRAFSVRPVVSRKTRFSTHCGPGCAVASRFAFFNGKMLYIQPLNPGQAGGGGGGGGTGRRCGFQLRLSLLQWGGRRP